MAQHSAAVYRRRRLGVLTALFVLVLVLGLGAWMLVAQPWADAGSAPVQTTEPSESSEPPVSPTAEEGESPSPEPSAEDRPVGIVACETNDVSVVAVTDAESYGAGVLPKLSISLTNTSGVDCTMNVGSNQQTFTVTSGKDVWWRSTDCQENPSDMVVTLKAGETVTSAEPVVWDRTRSAVGTCANENRPRAPGGGASYHVAVGIGGFVSATTRQIFLH